MLSELFAGISYNENNKKKEITRVEKIFHEKKRNFVSPSDHVILFCVVT